MLVRPEDTHKGQSAASEADLNLLYWGGEELQLTASQVCGKCRVVCGEDIEGDRDDWFTNAADQFYFFEAYDSASKCFIDPPPKARGPRIKGKVCVFCICMMCFSHYLFRGKVKEKAKARCPLVRAFSLAALRLRTWFPVLSLYGH